ncbi:MAG: hypothetical protein ACFE8G_11810, partial [Candidatus Hermodarchaeota archaeon]
LAKRVFVRDSTVREGEKALDVYNILEQKVKIVEMFENVRVRDMNVGYIGQVKNQWDLVKEIKECGIKLKIYSHLSSYLKAKVINHEIKLFIKLN